MLLQGLFVPLTCPFYRDGAPYFRKLEHNVRRYSLGPAAGLVALPPGGEIGTLTDAEARETLRTVAGFTANEKVLIAGVEHAGVPACVQRAADAAEVGFDAILLAPPPDWARLVRGDQARKLLLFYRSVADRSPLPVVLWSDAAPPSFALPLSAVEELAQHPNVIGLADRDLTEERLGAIESATASKRREVTVTTIFEAVTRRMLAPAPVQSQSPAAYVAVETLSAGGGVAIAAPVLPAPPQLKTRTRTVGFQVLAAGSASGMVPLLRAGASGATPVMAACAPQGCFEAYAAWKDGDEPLASERALRLTATDDLLAQLGPAAVKYACDWNGYFGGTPRLPRLALTAEGRMQVERALGEVRN